MTYPKEAFCCAQDFRRNAQSGVVWVVESLNPFPNVTDKRTLNGGESDHDGLGKHVSLYRLPSRDDYVTRFTGFLPMSLSVSDAKGTGDSGPPFSTQIGQ